MSVTYQAYESFGPALNFVKVYMADSTLTTAPANATILNSLASLISNTTEPYIVGSPYTSGSGSAILFVVRANTFVQATLQTQVQAIASLGSATVTITTSLVG